MVMRRWIWRIGVFYGAGLMFTVGMAWLMAAVVDVQQGRGSAAQVFEGEEDWSVQRWDRAGAVLIHSVRARGTNWSPQQAAGAPDSLTPGDKVTAWASYGSDTGTEWLVMEYGKAVVGKEVHVYENCSPGALFKVSVFDEAGTEIVAWEGQDPTAASAPMGTSKVPLGEKVLTKKVKIYLACDKVPGWNEIDAVGLVSDKGEVQWARRVSASTTYASISNGMAASSGDPKLIAPVWSGLHRRTVVMEDGAANREERLVDARGWPFLALKSERDAMSLPGASAQAAAAQLTGLTAYGGSGKALTGGFVPVTSTVAISTPTGNWGPTPIPLRPIWTGLLAGGVFWGVVLCGLWYALVAPRRFIREVARFRRGGCVQCGYDLGYDFLNGCPECGWRRDAANRVRRGERGSFED